MTEQTDATEVERPDFRALGLGTPWSVQAWTDAWDFLSLRGQTRLWRLVVDLMPLGSYGAPIAASYDLYAALDETTRARAAVVAARGAEDGS